MRRAVILAGGLGTRLRPYTTVLPKPLMPVGDRPILDIVVRQLARAQFDRITIATGYLAELIEAFFGDGSRYGIPIDYFREDEPLGTVGALSVIDGLDHDFLVMNGDILTDIDYAELLEHHREGGHSATIAAHQRDVQVSLGVMRFEQETDPTLVTGYIEKPTLSYVVSMGVYCFAPRVRAHIPQGGHLDFPDLVLRLIAAGETVRAWHSEDHWLDIGRHDDYEQAQDEFNQLRHLFLPDP
ncbi:MAG TPA: sugar phosphate nucleotidyltransferase [Solirubrobacteraceae bacterium]|nr:sugar phosphate nucleotidyltransferase [Solirubrobacteraceae bacterium]